MVCNWHDVLDTPAVLRLNSPSCIRACFQIGDRIIEVDGVDLRHSTHERAVEVIQAAGNPVCLLVQSLAHLVRFRSRPRISMFPLFSFPPGLNIYQPTNNVRKVSRVFPFTFSEKKRKLFISHRCLHFFPHFKIVILFKMCCNKSIFGEDWFVFFRAMAINVQFL